MKLLEERIMQYTKIALLLAIAVSLVRLALK